MTAPTLTAVPVHGRWYTLAGAPAVGYVSFQAVPGYRLVDEPGNAVVLPEAINVPLDANGEITTTVPATDDPAFTGVPFRYWVTVALTFRSYWFWLDAPAATVGTLELAAVSGSPGSGWSGVPMIGGPPPVADLGIIAGDTYAFDLTITNTDGSAYDPTGAVLLTQIRDPYGAPAATFAYSFTGNVATLSLTSAQTAALPPYGKWDCQLTDPTGTHTLLGGSVTVFPDVSRSSS